MTGNVKIVRHSYNIERVRKQYSVFELTETILLNNSGNSTNPVLTNLIRIEKDRNYHMAYGFDEWLRLRFGTNWAKCPTVTGLFKTKTPGVFYGDYIKNSKRNLLIFKFNSDRTQLVIDYYSGYCPYQKAELITDELRTILSKYNN